jgi:ElaB/YqjD/DUF883 family membrane-anchored ribosome-binding protein
MNSNLMDSVEEAMQPVEESARTAARAGSRELRNLITDVEELIKRAAHLDDAKLARAREKVEQTLATTKASLHNGTERVRETARQTDHYVHENPWSAVGIAAAAGAAIAVLLSTRIQR